MGQLYVFSAAFHNILSCRTKLVYVLKDTVWTAKPENVFKYVETAFVFLKNAMIIILRMETVVLRHANQKITSFVIQLLITYLQNVLT